MNSHYQLVLCTCPDEKVAATIAKNIIEQKLAACVNILPGLTSIYRWQADIETAEELLLFIKTRQDNYEALQTAINELHPYEVPEIIAIPINQGLPEYLQWIDTCLTSN